MYARRAWLAWRARSSGGSFAIGVNLAFEALEEGLRAGSVRALLSTVRAQKISAAILALMFFCIAISHHLRSSVTDCACLTVCLIGCVRAFTCRHARGVKRDK